MSSRWDELGVGAPTKNTSNSAAAVQRKSGSWAQNNANANAGGLGTSEGGSWGDTLTNGAMLLAGLTGGLGQTSIGQGASGGSTNGITINGTNSETAMKYNREMMETANAASAEEAQKNRDWQKMMSDTAFQRAVEDMKKAGINPILAAGTQAPMGYGSAGMMQTASITPETWGYGSNEGSSWGVNSSYSYNNFADAIGGLIKGLLNTEGETRQGIESMIDKGVETAKKTWQVGSTMAGALTGSKRGK